MTRSDHADAADLLPLERPGGRVIRLATLVADVARAVDPSLPRGRDGSTLVQIDCDVDASIVVPGHATAVRRLLESLVRSAVKAAACDDPDSDGPPLREVLVTAVDTGHAIEIEVADSGPFRELASVDSVAAERAGGSLDVLACAEGGTAVTLRLPHRQAAARAA